jgi:hypothetical protein
MFCLLGSDTGPVGMVWLFVLPVIAAHDAVNEVYYWLWLAPLNVCYGIIPGEHRCSQKHSGQKTARTFHCGAQRHSSAAAAPARP